MQRGIVIFAKNNEKINYVNQAKMCAKLAKRFLGNLPVCLITDEDISDTVFDVVRNVKIFKQQKRRYHQLSTAEELSYYNIGRTGAYELSPFDETLLIDADYFIQNDVLNLVWNNSQDVLMNRNYSSIYDPLYKAVDPYVGKWGPYMHWATVTYFKKSKQAKILFSLAKHIEENYNFYRSSYNLPGRMIRNDFIFSIAIHLMEANVCPLPVDTILNSYETDEILEVSNNSILFLCDRKNIGQTYTVRLNNLNVHIMNKIDLSNKLNLFEKAYA